jgi:hypothetical protein
MRQILETFDVKNKERIIVEEIERMMQNASNPTGGVPQLGGNNLPSGNGNASPRVDVLAQIAKMFGSGGSTPATNVQGQ